MIEHYEILAILPGTQTEEEVQPRVTQLQELLQKHGANIAKHEFWGKRKLAYEIEGCRQGYYDLTEFDLETSSLKTVDSALRLFDGVIRYQITRRTVKTEAQIAAENALRERIAAKRQAAREKEQAELVTPAPAPETAPQPEPAGPVESQKLDEKLEEILGADKLDI